MIVRIQANDYSGYDAYRLLARRFSRPSPGGSPCLPNPNIGGIMKNRFESSVIPDDQLEEYLKDKLTTKPDYGDMETTKQSTFVSDYFKRKEAEDKIRKDNNRSAGRGLKK